MVGQSLSRRSFIRSVSGGALGGVAMVSFPREARARYVLAHSVPVGGDDEHFWSFVRTQFPLKRDPVYLNNGTMGPSPYVVIDAVTRELEDVDTTGRYGGWEAARGRIASLVHAGEDEIALTHNVTEGINIVACGVPLRRGDEVVLTDHEHVGNALPWLARARRDGIVIRTFTPAPTAAETMERLTAVMTPKTRVVAVPHITCTTGHVLPAAEISALGRSRGVLVMIDGAHTPGMMPLDLAAMGCDFFASCGHKWLLGPKGTGFLYVRRDRLETLEPYWTGGGADAGWDVRAGTMSYRKDAHRFDFASQSSALSVGLIAAIDFMNGIGIDNVARRGKELARRLRTGLEGLGPTVEILTPADEGAYGPVVGFRVKTIPYDILYGALREKGIITRMVPENGVNCNRVSTHIYNSTDDVDRFVSAVRALL